MHSPLLPLLLLLLSTLLPLTLATDLQKRSLLWTPGLSLTKRQSCSSSDTDCGNLCVPSGYTCCSDGGAGCPIGTSCVPGGCCPKGKSCTGGGGTLTFPSFGEATGTSSIGGSSSGSSGSGSSSSSDDDDDFLGSGSSSSSGSGSVSDISAALPSPTSTSTSGSGGSVSGGGSSSSGGGNSGSGSTSGGGTDQLSGGGDAGQASGAVSKGADVLGLAAMAVLAAGVIGARLL